jgi:hypothetical protein
MSEPKRADQHPPEAPKPPPEPRHKFTYFVDNKEYESEHQHVTGKFVMERIVPPLKPGYTLFLEGKGSEPDQQINPDTSITLGDAKHPSRFYTVPPATFGAP